MSEKIEKVDFSAMASNATQSNVIPEEYTIDHLAKTLKIFEVECALDGIERPWKPGKLREDGIMEFIYKGKDHL